MGMPTPQILVLAVFKGTSIVWRGVIVAC